MGVEKSTLRPQEPKQASPRQRPEPHGHAQGPVPTPASSAPSPPPHPARGGARPGASQVLGPNSASPWLQRHLENVFELRVELSFFWQTLETDKNTHVKTFLGQNL